MGPSVLSSFVEDSTMTGLAAPVQVAMCTRGRDRRYVGA